MNYKEIASRITGISVPIFGISWNPPTPDVVVAKKVINFLEDRRVLYNPYELELPKSCIRSIQEIRNFLTQQLDNVDSGSELGRSLKAMRSACRKLLDRFEEVEDQGYSHYSSAFSMSFFSSVGELRGIFGLHIGKILACHGLNCESNLLTIIPFDDLE